MSDLVKRLQQEASKNGNRQSDTAFTNRQRKKFRYRNHLLTNAAKRIAELEEKEEHWKSQIRQVSRERGELRAKLEAIETEREGWKEQEDE